MRALFDIVHPAHALFFLHSIRELSAGGAEVLVLSRHKDITTRLLDETGIPHRPISSARPGRAGLAAELVERDARLLLAALRFRPDVMAGFGGLAISHVGALTRTPSLSFYDSETATLQMKLTLPLISEWHVPTSYRGPVAEGRTHRFAGFKQLAYLGPSRFVPDRERAVRAGLEPDRDNFFIRVVSWGAAHDLGRRGLDTRSLRRLIEKLSERGRVHVSSEGELPPEVERYQYTGDLLDVHHLLAHCRLYAGESASMAAEAAVLGVPALFLADFRLGYIDAMAGGGLVVQHPTGAGLEAAVTELLARDAGHYARLRDELLAGTIDVTGYVVQAIRSAGAGS